MKGPEHWPLSADDREPTVAEHLAASERRCMKLRDDGLRYLNRAILIMTGSGIACLVTLAGGAYALYKLSEGCQ